MSSAQKVGSLGEELVTMFLMKNGYKILDRNFRKPWGELDIVAERNGRIHFVEVKAMSQSIVSSETSNREAALRYIRSRVKKDSFRPEDHMNGNKMKRLSRIVHTYLMRKHVSDETIWQFDVATVYIDEEKKLAKINLVEELLM